MSGKRKAKGAGVRKSRRRTTIAAASARHPRKRTWSTTAKGVDGRRRVVDNIEIMAELRRDNWLPRIADNLGLSRQATNAWRRIPTDRIQEVAEFTGIPIQRLRPDLYDAKIIKRLSRPAK